MDGPTMHLGIAPCRANEIRRRTDAVGTRVPSIIVIVLYSSSIIEAMWTLADISPDR